MVLNKSKNTSVALDDKQLSNGLLAQMLPEVLTGGNWKWYPADTQEYGQICSLLNGHKDLAKYGVHSVMLGDGLLLYASVSKILAVMPNTTYGQDVEISQLRDNWQQIQENESRNFDSWLKNNLSTINSQAMFGMYLSGAPNKVGVIENKEYKLYKLPAERVFARLYNFWKTEGKFPMYMVGFDGKVKSLHSAFTRCETLRKQGQEMNNAKLREELDTLARNTLFGGLRQIYSGDALMCCLGV